MGMFNADKILVRVFRATGLAENTDSIFCEGRHRRGTANGVRFCRDHRREALLRAEDLD